jgi:hypothetical protein
MTQRRDKELKSLWQELGGKPLPTTGSKHLVEEAAV